MVDNMNPTNQFHPYLRETSVPVAERPETGLNAMLNKVGIDPTSVRSIGDQMKNLNMNQTVGKARSWAQANPAKVLGGLAAVAIGLGMMRGRRA
jgi:phosphoserine phosphatase